MKANLRGLKTVPILAAFAVFAIGAMSSSIKLFGPGAAVEYITSEIVIPVAQALSLGGS